MSDPSQRFSGSSESCKVTSLNMQVRSSTVGMVFFFVDDEGLMLT
jgi:hypothetical protein